MVAYVRDVVIGGGICKGCRDCWREYVRGVMIGGGICVYKGSHDGSSFQHYFCVYMC